MSRIATIFCVVYVLAAQAAVAEEDRGALWEIVQTCVANHALAGAAFPCLDVNTSDGEDRGYVILRPPVGEPDTILSPTIKIIGVEDPSLRILAAPNYFEDAWNARTFLSGTTQRPLAHGDVALAVNSRFSRSQDQFHIPIGCLSRQARQILQAIAADLSENKWVRITRRVDGLEFWGRRIAKETLAGVNPIRIADEGISDATGRRAQLTIVVAGVRLAEGHDGFVLLAWHHDPFGSGHQFTAVDFLDRSCSL